MSFFCVDIPFPQHHLLRRFLSLLNDLGTPVKSHLTTYARVYFWAPDSILLAGQSASQPEPVFDYCSFLVSFETEKCNSSSVFLLFQNCFGLFRVEIPYEFYEGLSYFCKNIIGILIGIALNLYIILGNTDILTILSLPIHEHRMCFHLFFNFFEQCFVVFIVQIFTSLINSSVSYSF